MLAHLEIQGRIKHPWPFTRSLRPIPANRTFYRRVKQGTLQFVFVKPFIAVVALLLYSQDFYHDGKISLDSGYIYCAVVTNMSVSISLYCLVLFYIATQEQLQIYKPFWKFVVVKSIIFFSFWQSFAISILLKIGVIDSREKALFYQDFIVLVETVLAAIAQTYAFTYREFIDLTKSPRPLLSNLTKILSMKDVLADAKNTFVDDEDDYERPLKEISMMDSDDDDEEQSLKHSSKTRNKRRYQGI